MPSVIQSAASCLTYIVLTPNCRVSFYLISFYSNCIGLIVIIILSEEPWHFTSQFGYFELLPFKDSSRSQMAEIVSNYDQSGGNDVCDKISFKISYNYA